MSTSRQGILSHIEKLLAYKQVFVLEFLVGFRVGFCAWFACPLAHLAATTLARVRLRPRKPVSRLCGGEQFTSVFGFKRPCA